MSHNDSTSKFTELKIKSFKMGAYANKNAELSKYLIYPLNLNRIKDQTQNKKFMREKMLENKTKLLRERY